MANDNRYRVVIPARYQSSRLPGKALAPLAGKPLLQHVWERASRSAAAEVLVATDDERIADAARGFGASVVMTAASHRSGTERAAEVAARLGWSPDDIVVNCQGDAPLVPPESLDQVAGLLQGGQAGDMATLCTAVHEESEWLSPHVVKVVADGGGRALYFSRAPIPAAGHGRAWPVPAWRHLGLYAYRVSALGRLAAAPACELELTEQLEQLRALWLGMTIRIAVARALPGPDVDTPADLERVARLLGAAPVPPGGD